MATHSGFIFSGGQMRAVVRVAATPTSAGDNEIVAAQAAGLKIRVVAFSLSGMSAGDTVHWRSATTPISHTFVLAANQVEWFGLNEHGWFETAAAAALNLNNVGGADIGVLVDYIVTP